jgi:hypothetical protein
MQPKLIDPRDAIARRRLCFAIALAAFALIALGVWLYPLLAASRIGAGPYSFAYGLIVLSFLLSFAVFLLLSVSFVLTVFAQRASPCYARRFRRTLATIDLLILIPIGAFIAHSLWAIYHPKPWSRPDPDPADVDVEPSTTPYYLIP